MFMNNISKDLLAFARGVWGMAERTGMDLMAVNVSTNVSGLMMRRCVAFVRGDVYEFNMN